MSATYSRLDCGTSSDPAHNRDADLKIVFAQYNLKALTMLLTDLNKAGLLEDFFAEVRADDELMQKVESLVATLEEALEGYAE